MKCYNTVNCIMCLLITFSPFPCLTWMDLCMLNKVLCVGSHVSEGLVIQKSVFIYQPLSALQSFLLPGFYFIVCILILCSFNSSLITNHQRIQIFLISWHKKKAISLLNLCTNIDARGLFHVQMFLVESETQSRAPIKERTICPN